MNNIIVGMALPMEMKSAGLMPQPSQNIMQLPAS